MTVEEIKDKIKQAEQSCVSEIYDVYGEDCNVDVLVMDVYSKKKR